VRRKLVLFVSLLVLIPLIFFFVSTKHSTSASLNFVTKWGTQGTFTSGSATGEFDSPEGVAVNSSSGDVYVTDTNNNRIQVFNADGSFKTSWGPAASGDWSFNKPKGIAIDSSGEVYVVDTNNHRIKKFSSAGALITQWGSYGSDNTEFHFPMGIAVDSAGYVYVADNYNNRVQKFSSAGDWQSTITHSFSFPYGVAVDSSNDVYVTDSNNNKVDKFDSAGNLIWQRGGTAGSDHGSFAAPSGIAVDSSGYVYIADKTNNRIEKFSSAGDWQSTIENLFINPYGVAVDSSKNVYVADTDNHRIKKFDITGAYLSDFGSPNPPSGGAFYLPIGVAINASGYVYIADTYNDRIQKFDNSGGYKLQWGTPGSGDKQFAGPTAIAINPSSGNVYVTDSGNNRVEEFDSTGATLLNKWGTVGTANKQFNNPTGIAIDTLGNVYVVDTGNNRIQEFNSDGSTLLNEWGGSGSTVGKFSSPTGIAIDSSGYIHVVDTGNNRIQIFDTPGHYKSQWAIVDAADTTGIGVDTLGNVYVANYADDSVQKYSNSGTLISSIGGFGTGNGQFENPTGIALDPSGNLFVVDSYNSRIQKFSVNLDLGIYFSDADQNFYRGDNTVNALVKAGNTLYLGGSFGLEAVDLVTGQKKTWTPGLPRVNENLDSTVYALAYSPDNKILYVGATNGLYEYDTSAGTGTLDPDFTDTFGGHGENYATVYALAIIDNTLYVGGNFASITNSGGSNTRVSLASYNISTPIATLNEWEKDTNSDGIVRAFATSDDGKLFVGGQFSTINSLAQPVLAEFDSGDLVDAFAPGFADDDTIYALAYNDGKVYAGGLFTTVNSHPFENLVSLDETTDGHAIASWAPSTQGPVIALAVEKNYLYVGGGAAEDEYWGIVAQGYNLQNGNSIDWYPETTQDIQPQNIQSMLATDQSLYVGLNNDAAEDSRTTTDVNKNFAVKNKNKTDQFTLVPEAQAADLSTPHGNLLADIGGLSNTVYLAKFDAIPAPTATPTNTPTPTTTITISPTVGPTVTSSVCSSQKPGVPTNIIATAGPGNGQVTLSWTAPSAPVTDYSIIYSNDQSVQKWGVISTGDATSYVISQLPLSQTYYFWINAVNGCMPGGSASVALSLVVGTGGQQVQIATASPYILETINPSSSSSVIPSPSPMPSSGPADVVKVGVGGAILTIIGGVLLLAL